MKGITMKQPNNKNEVKASKKSVNLHALKKHVYKFSSAVVLVAAAYSSFYSVLADHTTNTPQFVSEAVAAIVTIGLVLVLAQCDNSK